MKIIDKRIPITQPSITRKETDMVCQAVRNCWGKNAYKYIGQFEKEFSDYIGAKYGLATSSCTGALHLSLLSIRIKPGDEIIVPDITWAATVFPIIYVGAKPIFIDIDKDTWCINPEKIEQNITKKTRAIIPVHLYGHPAEMELIKKIAKEYKLHVIEDAAESVGALYNGQQTGSLGDISAFSFHGTKTLTTGEGGILLTNDRKIFKRASMLNDLAKSKIKTFWNLEIGFKYKMTDLQAALGLAQLSRIDELLAKKKIIYQWYLQNLKDIDGLKLNYQAKGCTNSYWMITIVFDKKYKITKKIIMNRLNQYNIDPRPFFYPLSSLPPFKTKVNNPIAYDISRRAINLPCGYTITRKEVDYVCDKITTIIKTTHH